MATINPAAMSPVDQIEYLYQTILGRPSDTAGAAHYAGKIAAGVPLSQLQAEMAASPEARNLPSAPAPAPAQAPAQAPAPAPAPTNADAVAAAQAQANKLAAENLVKSTFKNVIGRDPEPAALNFYAGEVLAGRSNSSNLATQIAYGAKGTDQAKADAWAVANLGKPIFGTSTPPPATTTNALDARRREIFALYDQFFGRTPDDAGLNYYVNDPVGSKILPDQIQKDFLFAITSGKEQPTAYATDLLKQQGWTVGPDGKWLEPPKSPIQDLTVTPGGVTPGGALAGPGTAGFDQFQSAKNLYSKYLNRTPTEAEASFWSDYASKNTPEQTMAAFKEGARRELENTWSTGYSSVLGRRPSAGEVNYWVDYALNNGVTQAVGAFNVGAQEELARRTAAGGLPAANTFATSLSPESTINYPYGTDGGIYRRTPKEAFMFQGELAKIPGRTTIPTPVIPTALTASPDTGTTPLDLGVAAGTIARPLTFTPPAMPGATAGTTQSIGQFIQSKIPPVTPTKEQAGPVFTPAQVTAQLELERLKAANAPSAVGLARGGDAGSEARRMLLNLGGAPVKKFSDGGSAGESSSDVDLMEEIASGFAGGREPGKAEEAFRALVEGGQGFLGLEPGRKGSEPYRTGQALSNLPALALPAAAIKGTGKAKDALKALGKKETPAVDFARVFDEVDKLPTNQYIDDIRSAHIGGVGNFGEGDAKYLFYRVPGGEKYIKQSQQVAKKNLGNQFMGYRLMSRDEFEELQSGAVGDLLSFSLDRNAAEALRNFVKNQNRKDLVVAQVPLTPKHVVAFGSPGEKEIIVDTAQGWSMDDFKLADPVKKAQGGEKEMFPSAKLVDTPEFQNWFGTSKAVDEAGSPTVLYHATPEDIEEFIPGGLTPERSGKAIWMTPDKYFQPAAHNIRMVPGKPGYMYGSSSDMFTPGTNVMPLFASIKNPLVTTEKTWKQDFQPFGGSPWTLTEGEVNKIKKAGHDGIMYYDEKGKLAEVAVFEPTQVKSAISNEGTFNPKSGVITKAKGGEVSTTDFIRKRQAGSPPEGEVPGEVEEIPTRKEVPPTRSEQALRAYVQAANPRANIKQQVLRPGTLGAVRTSNPDEILLSRNVGKNTGTAEEIILHELEHSLELRGGNPLGVVDRKDGEPITTDNNYRFDILYNMKGSRDKKVEKPGVGELFALQRSGDGERKRLAMINNFVKNRAAIEQFFDRPITSSYFHPNMLKAQERFGTQGALFAEQIADLSALEQLTGKSLTRDKDMRKLLFPDDRSAEVYDAITGYRQTRLDAKDLPPYTPITPEKGGVSSWLKEKLGMKDGGEVTNDEYIQQMFTGTPPMDRQKNPGILPPEIRGAVDVPLDFLNLLVRGGAGAVAGPAYGLYKGVTSDKFGTPEGVQEASSEAGRMMQKITGTPKTQTARDVLGFIGEKAEALKLAPTPQLLTLPAPGPGAASALLRNYELAQTAPAGVIKLPGGNWLAGQVEQFVGPLKREVEDITVPQFAGEPDVTKIPERNAALNKFIETGLTRYIKNDMASEKDTLRNIADENVLKASKAYEAEMKQVQKAFDRAEKIKAEGPRPGMPAGTWENAINAQLGRAQRMADEAKEKVDFELRHALPFPVLNDDGGLAASFQSRLAFGGRPTAISRREAVGQKPEGVAQTAAGKAWEDMADLFVKPERAGGITAPNYFMRERDAERVLTKNPWLTTVPPETPVYVPQDVYRTKSSSVLDSFSADDLGFKHITDELRNAMDPESGLPANLLLTPDEVASMGMDKAARHVIEINKWRDMNRSAANALLAQKSVSTYKQYETVPEKGTPNTRGLQWMELKLLENPDTQLPENWTVKQDQLGGKNVFYVVNDKGENVVKGAGFDVQDSPEQAIALAKKELSKKELAEALKYEGEVMGHCVGGYCPDVESGKSRIISLRDAKGEPHVTIEVAPGEDFKKNPGQWLNTLPVEQQQAIIASGVKPGDLPEYQQWVGSVPEKIVQIKGKGNRKAAEQYQPFINDFIASQPWSEIGDLSYTNLVPLKPGLLKNAQDSGFNPRVIATVKDQPYITKDEFRRLADLFNIPPDLRSSMGKYAAGGEVTKFIKMALA